MVEAKKELSLIEYCKYATPTEVLKAATNGNVRGLDMLALRMVMARNKLPVEVVNVMIVYFFKTFANTVYDRNDLLKIYDHWLKHNVQTFVQAKQMTATDIHTILKKTDPA
ncbi:hypothetical protein AM500_13930 [Bacillus sp. FJAT-18017]|uniref:hypothetical protein n=1 Tax=unclassified Bacillus (in: firmicutes) TaxID=185979 RepID=UPI0005C6E531|nr:MULTISPECIES: hypothetical protein [unclassified Bacillus (in: firmicutes)]ALC90764.1 hypothetical protein AM500_13930 [Bacillus sp. FJAT-18017]